MTLTELGTQILENKDAVIFDLDGTLIDSNAAWGRSYFDLFKQFPRVSFNVWDFYDNTIGKSLKEQAEWQIYRYKLPLQPEQVTSFWTSNFFEKYWPEIDFFPHSIDFMRCLRDRGVKFAVCTAGAACLDRCFEKSPIKPDVFLSCETVGRMKPDPLIYHQAMEKMQTSPQNCVIFEDSPHAIEGAYRTGCPVVGVLIGRKKSKRNSVGCDFTISSWGDLAQ